MDCACNQEAAAFRQECRVWLESHGVGHHEQWDTDAVQKHSIGERQ